MAEKDTMTLVCEAYERGRRDEREECAKIVDNLHRIVAQPYTDPNPVFNKPEAVRELDANLISSCADAIRGRGEHT